MYDRDRRSASGSEFFVGLLVVALLVFLLWYFLLRPRAPAVGTINPTAAPTLVATQEDTLQKALEKVVRTPTPTATPTFTPRPTTVATPSTYVVQEGDVLVEIASRFGVTVEEIVQANDLADPDVLAVGQELVIPKQNP